MPPRVQVHATGAPAERFGCRDAEDLPRRLRRAALAVLRAESHPEAEISVTLLDDAAIASLNERYLGHEGPTDVLAFALHEAGDAPLGDVYIGHEQARRQARRLGVPPGEELVRLVVHGTLHVLGHEHPPGDERERSPMWALQERIVAELSEDER